MSKDFGYLAIIAMLAAAVLLVYLQHIASNFSAKKRTASMRSVANSLGLSFTETDKKVARDVLAKFSRANSDQELYEWSAEALNILRGQRAGAQLLVCEFKWAARRRKSSGRFSTTVTCWQSSDLELPEFILASLEHGSQVPGWSESELIQVTQSGAFTNQYLLAAKSESAVQALFGPELTSYFAANPGWTVESSGDGVLICKAYEDVEPERLVEFLNQCEKIYRLLSSR